ncbi:unnamed protein product [Nesidiocoris tenuis]|uniref:Uncharacterized protein n=1 Tax=Nesidiocoris tenuis TaxID=355587 RepID=A0A6H5GHA1_9HEMI|nr:unnamed protein product [Nesidiocoris tenuis]
MNFKEDLLNVDSTKSQLSPVMIAELWLSADETSSSSLLAVNKMKSVLFGSVTMTLPLRCRRRGRVVVAAGRRRWLIRYHIRLTVTAAPPPRDPALIFLQAFDSTVFKKGNLSIERKIPLSDTGNT